METYIYLSIEGLWVVGLIAVTIFGIMSACGLIDPDSDD